MIIIISTICNCIIIIEYLRFNYNYTNNINELILTIIIIIMYRRTGFKCEHVIIANCDFSPSAQLLECNVCITHSINQYVARA